MKNSHYLTCRLGRQWYGIRIEHVIEVLHMVALEEMPGSQALGVMTLREQVIPVIDMREQLGLTNIEYTLETPIVGIRCGDQLFGLVVDEADDVVQIDSSQISPYVERDVTGIARVGDMMVFLLEIEQFFQRFQTA